jgi:endonuclease/exonuclease/phosphatase family metal-dependent hydrolase
VWKLIGFYRHPNPTNRHEEWNLLKHLQELSPTPWLCLGDFNEITKNSEKTRAVLKRESQMVVFRDTLFSCQLNDLGFIGPKYTWTNGRDNEEFTVERLDRALGNFEW